MFNLVITFFFLKRARKRSCTQRLKTVGKEAFKLRMFVCTDGVGRLLTVWVGLNFGFSSSSSILRVTCLKGSSMYFGNGLKDLLYPILPGCDGLNGLSCSIKGGLNPPVPLRRQCDKRITLLFSRTESRSLSELTRQITPPTKNGHAPPPTESRESYQSVNPYGVRAG